MSLRSRWRSAKAERTLDQQIDGLRERLDRLADDAPERREVLNNLGNRLRDRYLRAGDVDDLDQAVDCYRRALAVPGFAGASHLVSGNLAASLVDRYHASGDLTDLEWAIRAAREAAANPEAASPDRAQYLTNLSFALNERYDRTRQQPDLDDAITSAEQAVELAAGDTRVTAIAGVNLAAALLVRRAPDDAARAAELLDRAVSSLPEGSPEQQQARLGLGMARAAAGVPGSMGLEADDATIAAFADVARQAPAGSLRRSAALHATGKARWAQYERTGDPVHLEAAIAALRAAADDSPPDAGDLPRYLNDLGIALSELSYRSDSAQGLAQALAVWVRAQGLLQERFDSVAMSYKLGQQTLSTELGLAERVVSVYLELADRAVTGRERALRNAVWTAEGTKSRLLTDLLGRGDLPAPSGVAADQLTRERKVLDELRALDTAAIAEHARVDVDDGDDGAAHRRVLRQELDGLWGAISASGESGREYVALRRRQHITWDMIAELAALLGPSTALASLFLTNSRALLFIVRAGFDAPAVCQVEIDRDGWLDVMSRFDREVRRSAGPASETWDQRLQPLLRSAVPHLDGVERVVLAPAVWGVQLPWATIARRAGWRTPDAHAMPLITVESFGTLRRLLGRDHHGTGNGAVVIGNPTGDLRHAEAESRNVGAMLGVEPLVGPAATTGTVMAALRSASIAHIAGHASFEPGAPLDSGIVLADGLLTARDIMADRIRLDLIVLSACQTGVAESLGGNEFAGLTQAFHVAGVRCVVASLWKVDDPVTALLMARFYTNWMAGSDLARALSEAMDITNPAAAAGDTTERGRRDIGTQPTSTAPPPTTYYWDSFVISGDWSTPAIAP